MSEKIKKNNFSKSQVCVVSQSSVIRQNGPHNLWRPVWSRHIGVPPWYTAEDNENIWNLLWLTGRLFLSRELINLCTNTSLNTGQMLIAAQKAKNHKMNRFFTHSRLVS